MSVIKLMDEKLANMIAAGEVVERPASIIKELVENAIDAKASVINVFIVENGLKSISVTDNGEGMSKQDIKMAPLRHATSKITSEYDLERIKTLGFRGEALAAISAVSKLKITSRQKEGDAYTFLFHEANLVSESKTSHNIGTTIEVSDLFYNTPARLKYLKSEYSERAAIIDTFNKLALSHPETRFSLTMDEKLVKETFGNNDYYSLLGQIYGLNVLSDLKTFEETFSNIKVKAFLASPKIARSRNTDITIFVNGRYIKNYGITKAVIDGYHTFLMTNKYPLALIFIELDPYLLDVNIHPQKMEVKFANQQLLNFQIEKLVKENLTGRVHEISKPFRTLSEESHVPTYLKEELDFVYNEEEKENIIAKIPDFDYLGNLASTYLLFQNEEGLYLIDQHAAEERVNYEYYSNLMIEKELITLEMFVPRALSLTNQDLNDINNYLASFKRLGFEFNDEMALIKHPNYLKEKDLDQAVENMLVLLREKDKVETHDLIDNMAKSRSCKASIKAGDKLSVIEVESLIKRLRLAKNPYTCPHGRPTIINISHYEIAKMFKRIV